MNTEETQQQRIAQAIRETEHPEIAFSLDELGMIGEIDTSSEQPRLVMKIPFANIPIKDLLVQIIQQNLAARGLPTGLTVDYQEMTPEERQQFMARSQQGWKL